MKYAIILFALILGSGALLFTMMGNSTTSVTEQVQVNENPFGEGAEVTGTIDATPESGSTAQGATPSGTGVSPDTSKAVTPTSAGTITRAELSAHNSQSDCWIGYKGTVYDVTNWLPKHPGSAGAIAPFCGTADEFAAAFNKQHGTKRDARLEKEGVKEGTLGN